MTRGFGLPAELAELADEYEIVSELGRGGSAIVYRARDRVLGREVAIKVVHPRPTSPDDDPVARLAREARTVAQLQHPGIVTVYAVRRLRSGGLTLVMQYVPGATLKASIQRGGPFGAERAEQILRDVAQALAYAHARQIVHRDVKPENIFLDAESGRALLADFGIARSTEADSITMTGTAIGTPFYMSPEQVDGRTVDGRSDLYSLGLVTWEMLTGLRPWDGESLYHVIYKQKHDDLPPIEAIRPDVPRRLQYIVERMLQKQPAARWAGAEGLLVQLDRRILPSDYAKWQAGLPGRVARHRATVAARATTKAPDTGVAAATVQFKPKPQAELQPIAQAAALGDTLFGLPIRSDGGSTDLAGDPFRAVISRTAPVEQVTIAPDAPPVHAPVPAVPAESAALDAPPAYETVAPSWAHGEPEAPAAGAQHSGRRIATSAMLVVSAVALGALVVHARRVPTSQAVAVAPVHLAVPAAAAASQTPLSARWGSRAVSREVSGSSVMRLASPDLVAAGDHHACSVSDSGVAACWGNNDEAQLGDGSVGERSTEPRLVAGVMTYAGLAAGASHTCGVTRAGDVYCWGANDAGQLGDGTRLRRAAPVRIAGTGTYRMVRGGRAHTCALDVDGSVRCWGDNSFGQLGDGTRAGQSVPTPVALPAGASAVAIATGAQHSCALLRDDRVVCWGSNFDGQLGIAGDLVSGEPHEVPGVRASAIGAGEGHTCAVLRSGPVRCWGRDAAGQLGASPPTPDAPGRLTVVPGGEAVATVTGGTAHSCALTQGGMFWCWGNTNATSPRVPARIGRGGYVAVAAAASQSCVALRGRPAECWTTVESRMRRRSRSSVRVRRTMTGRR